MTQQLDLFSVHREPLAAPVSKPSPAIAAARAEGERLKRQGMDRATWNKERMLGHAREIAHDVAHGILPHVDGEKRADGLCTADDVQHNWQRERPLLDPLGNLAGSIFAGGNWEFTGERVKSVRSHAHANELKIWKWSPKDGSQS